MGEPHVTHGAVVGLDSCVAHKMVFELVPAVEHTATDLKEEAEERKVGHGHRREGRIIKHSSF